MKSQSLKLFAAAFVLGLVTIFASADSAYAQDILTFETPFDFHVGKDKLSAGKYEIKRLSHGRYLLRSAAGSKNSMLIVANFQFARTDDEKTEQVVFNRYGETYFLRQISDRRDTATELTESGYESKIRKSSRKNEEKLARKDKKPEQISVNLNR